jgi:hypothetical protein
VVAFQTEDSEDVSIVLEMVEAKISRESRTFAGFLLEPAFPCGKGAAAGFFPLGGCH